MGAIDQGLYRPQESHWKNASWNCLYQRRAQHGHRRYILTEIWPQAEFDQRVYACQSKNTYWRTYCGIPKLEDLFKKWLSYNERCASPHIDEVKLDTVFVNCSEDNKINPLTTNKIAEAQKADATYKHLFKCNAVIDQWLEIKLIENTLCVCKDGRQVIPKPLQWRVVM